MRRFCLCAVAVALLAGVSAPTSVAYGQGAEKAPHKVGLIDMAHVFQNYKKFEVLREELKAEIAKSDSTAKQMAEAMKTLQAQMADLKSGSPDYVNAEKRLLKMKSEFDAFTQGARRDLMRRESAIYKTVYLEVSDAVNKYADYYKYTLIIRFDRQALDDKATPPEVVQRMNKQVVFHRADDDITDAVLQYLNRLYDQSNPSKPAVERVAAALPKLSITSSINNTGIDLVMI